MSEFILVEIMLASLWRKWEGGKMEVEHLGDHLSGKMIKVTRMEAYEKERR